MELGLLRCHFLVLWCVLYPSEYSGDVADARGQTLTDLNDFITPSQACIKPVEQLNAPVNAAAAATVRISKRLFSGLTDWDVNPQTEIVIDSTGAYFEVASAADAQSTRKLEQAQINLNDCLACR
jgi:hypothetical protein